MADLRGITQSIEELVERSTVAIAGVHKSLSRLPFDAVEQVPALAPRARKVHQMHDEVIDLIYGSVRRVNHAVFGALVTIVGLDAPRKTDSSAPRAL